ncbi:flagella basal body P-ring formation protein FlgA [Marinicellulosiphila megalodicopiae]|uniref:flagella basal body P-ring formation protein FlgA n=1 Tax=Marinicellulosiphila megalodicopiae TaxID=2724896 RepID=UPI003BAF891D
MKFWALLITLSVNLYAHSEIILVEGPWITPSTFGFEKVPEHRLFIAPVVDQTIKIKRELINKKLKRVGIPEIDSDSEYISFKGFNSENVKQLIKQQCLDALPAINDGNWVLNELIADTFIGEIQSVSVVINQKNARCDVLLLNGLDQVQHLKYQFELKHDVLVWRAKNDIASGTNILANAYQSLEQTSDVIVLNITPDSRANGYISKGQIITERDIKSPMMVWKRDEVELISIAGAVILTVKAIALESGNLNETIYVEYNEQKIQATIVAQNKVEIRGGS